VDASGKERHALILHGVAVKCQYAEVKEVLRLDKLWQDGAAIVSSIGRGVYYRAVIIREAHEARVFNAVALVLGYREDNALAHCEARGKLHLVIGVGEPPNAIERVPEASRYRTV